MRLSKLELVVLNATADGYISVANIVRNESDMFAELVMSRVVVEDALSKLCGNGLVDGFTYDVDAYKYCRITRLPSVLERVWFDITGAGREALEGGWDDAWTREWKRRIEEGWQERGLPPSGDAE